MCPAYVQQWWSWTICGIKYRRLRIFHVGVTSVLCVVWLMAWIYLLASTKMDKNADMHMFYVLFETRSLFKRFHEMLFTNNVLCLPHEMGRHIVLAPLSVCPSVCLSHFRVCSISFEPLVGFTNYFARMSAIIRRYAMYVWPRSVVGQDQSLRLNIVWLYFESALNLLKPWWDLQITFMKC